MHIDNTKLPILLSTIILCAVLLQSCQQPHQANSSELLLAAASSLTPVGPALASTFQSSSGITVRFSFGATGNLEQQIRQGAPFDIFLPAAPVNARSLQNEGFTEDALTIFAVGRLAAWSKSLTLQSMDDLRQPSISRIALANPRFAPYGLAAEQALKSAGLWEAVRPKLVFAENIYHAFQMAETGNADVALVSLASVLNSGFHYLLVDSNLHAPLQQTAVVIRSSQNLPAASAFVEFLQSEPAQRILLAYGFEHP